MSAEGWYVGQRVTHYRHGHATPDAGDFEVAKVGRTLVHVSIYGHLYGFQQDTGWGNKDFSGRIERPEDTARRAAHKTAQDRLAATGVVLDHRSRKFTTDQLDALAELIEGWTP